MRLILLLTLACSGAAGTLSAQAESSREEVIALAGRLQKAAKQFSKRFDKELDKSVLEDSDFEKIVDKRADKLKSAIGDVRRRAKRGKFEKTREKLDRALQFAHDVNEVMIERRFSDRLERQWDSVRADLNVLAGFYDLAPL